MRKSNAQRQHDYRDRHLKQAGDEYEILERINQMISVTAKQALKRLASYYGFTQRIMLERAIAEAEHQLIHTLPNEQQNHYYDMTLTLRSNDKEGASKNEKLTEPSKTD